jgi:hypothetical protein
MKTVLAERVRLKIGAEPNKVESAVDNLRPLALSDPERAREQISVRQRVRGP